MSVWLTVEDVKKIAVIGAGIMGHGIAMSCAMAGYDTVMAGRDEGRLQNAMAKIKEGPFGLEKSVAKGKMSREAADDILGRIHPTTDLKEAGREADLIIEAISENLELKRSVFRQLDSICPEKTVLTSSTSTIMIADLALVTNRPDRFAGMHWFNPAQMMPLIELVRGEQTSNETFDFLFALSEKMGKKPVTVNDGPGFFTSRFMTAFLNEAARLLEAGVAGVKEIDTMCKLGFSFPMGPFELMDVIGLDTMLQSSVYIYGKTADEKFKTPEVLKKMVADGFFGDRRIKKGSRGGWYDAYGIEKEGP